MRDIRFRAWDVIKKEMRTFGDERVYGTVTNIYLFERFSDCLMQYTGIKDKNGREIYEGDIVEAIGSRRSWVGDNRLVDTWVEKLQVVWGSYDDGEYLDDVECWMIGNTPLSDAGSLTHGHAQYKIEVIGNIHKNPELL